MALAKRYEQGEAGEMMGWSSHGEVPPKAPSELLVHGHSFTRRMLTSLVREGLATRSARLA
jgi:hypothetical protein